MKIYVQTMQNICGSDYDEYHDSLDELLNFVKKQWMQAHEPHRLDLTEISFTCDFLEKAE